MKALAHRKFGNMQGKRTCHEKAPDVVPCAGYESLTVHGAGIYIPFSLHEHDQFAINEIMTLRIGTISWYVNVYFYCLNECLTQTRAPTCEKEKSSMDS